MEWREAFHFSAAGAGVVARGSRAPGPGRSCISRAAPGATRASGTVPAVMKWFPPSGEAATFYLIFKVVNNRMAKSSGRVLIQDSSLGKAPLQDRTLPHPPLAQSQVARGEERGLGVGRLGRNLRDLPRIPRRLETLAVCLSHSSIS